MTTPKESLAAQVERERQALELREWEVRAMAAKKGRSHNLCEVLETTVLESGLAPHSNVGMVRATVEVEIPIGYRNNPLSGTKWRPENLTPETIGELLRNFYTVSRVKVIDFQASATPEAMKRT